MAGKKPLRPKVVGLILKYHRIGYSVTDLAAHFGVSRATVSRIVNLHTHTAVSEDAAAAPELLTPEVRGNDIAKNERIVRRMFG